MNASLVGMERGRERVSCTICNLINTVSLSWASCSHECVSCREEERERERLMYVMSMLREEEEEEEKEEVLLTAYNE